MRALAGERRMTMVIFPRLLYERLFTLFSSLHVVLQRIADRLPLRHGLASSPTGFKCRMVQMRASLCYVLVHVDSADFAEEVGRQWRERFGRSQQHSGSLRPSLCCSNLSQASERTSDPGGILLVSHTVPEAQALGEEVVRLLQIPLLQPHGPCREQALRQVTAISCCPHQRHALIEQRLRRHCVTLRRRDNA